MTTDEQLFSFSSDDQGTSTTTTSPPSWKVLSVEDDRRYQDSLIFSLQHLTVLGRPVELLTANSATEAALILSRTHDIGLILLDVVMEEDNAGLGLVETIRNTLGNQTVRIVLLTGQPGVAPRTRVVQDYDINEYWDKAELQDRLPSIVTTNLRTWQTMTELEQAHTGLQMVVEACQHISDRHDLTRFSDTVLEQIAQVLGLKGNNDEGILCLEHSHQTTRPFTVLSSFGAFHQGQSPSHDLSRKLSTFFPAIELALTTQKHQFFDNHAVLFFPHSPPPEGTENNTVHTVLLKTSEPLSQSVIRLLSVFSENIKTGFTNLMLLNRLQTLSYFDDSLRIYNRNWLIRNLNLLSPTRWQSSALLLFSLNDYAERTLTFGHTAVERFLASLVKQLKQKLPTGATMVRLGRETLATLYPAERLPDAATLQQLAFMDIPIENASRKARLTVAKLNLDDVDQGVPPEEVLHLAQSVLYGARLAKQPFRTYQPEVLKRIQHDFDLLQQLIRALEEDQLTIFLQPKIRLTDEQVVGFEALVRWPRPDGSFTSPGLFLPLAEKSGLLDALDLQVLHKAFNAAKRLSDAGYALPVAFNATWSDLNNDEYVDQLMSRLDSGILAPAMLELEITETQAMAGYQELAPRLQALRTKGMSVSIDDFGTGHSSLAYLTTLPADTIKIDRSFVQQLDSGSIGEHVTETVIALGRRFNFAVVAEGIETRQQQARLVKMGCLIGQGFLFAKPMPVDDILQWLSTS